MRNWKVLEQGFQICAKTGIFCSKKGPISGVFGPFLP
jgi:hypothetical protein